MYTLKFVAGNPTMFTKVRQQPGLTKRSAIEGLNTIASDWRAWIEKDGKLYLENDTQKAWRLSN